MANFYFKSLLPMFIINTFLMHYANLQETKPIITKLGFSSLPSNQLFLTSNNTMVVFTDRKVFTYDLSGTITEYTGGLTTAAGDANNFALFLFQTTEPNILHVICGSQYQIESFDNDLSLSQYQIGGYLLDKKCSLIQLAKTTTFFLSYGKSATIHTMVELEYKNDIFTQLNSVDITNSGETITCNVYFSFPQYAFCIYITGRTLNYGLHTFTDGIFNNLMITLDRDYLYSTMIMHLSNQMFIVLLSPTNIKGYLIKSLPVSGSMPVLTPQEKGEFIGSDFLMLAIGRIDEDTAILYITSIKYIEIKIISISIMMHMGYPSTIEMGIKTVIHCSIALFDVNTFGLIASYDDNTSWLMIIKLPFSSPFCEINTEIKLATGNNLDLNRLNIPGNTMEFGIRFVNTAVPPIIIDTLYLSDAIITFTSTGIYSYSYDIVYILNALENIYMPVTGCSVNVKVCFGQCKTCTQYGDQLKPFCDSCNVGLNLDQNRCVPCDFGISYYYIDANKNYQCTGALTCTVNYMFLLIGNTECLITCPLDKICIKICPNICNPPLVRSLFTCNCLTDEQADNEKRQIVEDPKYIKELSNPPSIIHKNNSTYVIYIDDSRLGLFPNKLSNFSRIISGELDKVRDHYHLLKNEEIIVYLLDTIIENSRTNKIDILLYHKIDSDYVSESFPNNEITIGITIPVKNITDPDYINAKHLFTLNINAFNPYDSFFRDICYDYDTMNNTDITRKDRYQYYLQDNASYCPNNSIFLSINYDENTVDCMLTSQPMINSRSFDSIKEGFMNALLDGNWEVVLCYMLFKNVSLFKENYGFWFSFVIILIMIGDVIWFCFTKYTSLENYLNTYTSKQNKENQTNLKVSSFNKNVQFQQEDHKLKSQLAIEKNQHINNENSLISFVKIQSQIQNLNQSTQFDAKKNDNSIQIMKDNNEDKKDIIPAKVISQYSNNDYDNMNFDDLCKNDHRNSFQQYWGFLINIHPFFFTFYMNSSAKTLRTIKISLFFIRFSMDFAFSAFFYLDQYISLKYTGRNTFFKDFPVSIYSFLICTCINIGLSSLSNSTKGINKIIKENQINKKELIQDFLNVYKIRIILFHISKFIFQLCFWYYVIVFCGVYKNSQMLWFTSGLKSFGLNQIFPFIITLGYTISMKLAIKYKSKRTYNLLRVFY